MPENDSLAQRAWELADKAMEAVKRGELPATLTDEQYRKMFLALLIFEARFEREIEDNE
jgi:hypothetical protein